MALGTVVYRQTQGYGGSDNYQMRLRADLTGNVSGNQRQVKITLEGYARGSGGYEQFSAPVARITRDASTVLAGNANVNSWWPRNTWIVLREYTGYFTGGSTYNFRGYYNNTNTSAWMPQVGEWYAAVSLAVPAIPTAPSGSISHSNVTRTSARISLSVSSWGTASSAHGTSPYIRRYRIGTGSWTNGNSTSSVWNTGNVLTPNTTYNYEGQLRNNNNLYSPWYRDSFTTTGNAPTISSHSATSISRTGATITYNVSYDTNASFQNMELQYGLSTDYGTTQVGPVISGLQPNTKYYYRIRVRDNWNRWSNWSTGDFTTAGNAPVITSHSVSSILETSAYLDVQASYDTNASYSSMSVEYGKTISYGQTSSGSTLTDLDPDTLYYYRVRVRDNWDRWSNWETGSFTTLPDKFIKVITDTGTPEYKKLYAIIDTPPYKIEIKKAMIKRIQ